MSLRQLTEHFISKDRILWQLVYEMNNALVVHPFGLLSLENVIQRHVNCVES